MKHVYFLITLLTLFYACRRNDSQFLETPASSTDNYTILPDRVGEITRGTTVNQLQELFDKQQIRLTHDNSGYFNRPVDHYHIASPSGTPLLTLTPASPNDTAALITQIVIRDTSFRTPHGINLNSRLKDIRDNYYRLKYQQFGDQPILSIPAINAHFLLDTTNLPPRYFNPDTRAIQSELIPDSTRISGIVIYWDPSAPTSPVKALFTAAFWNDILTRVLTWCIVTLPSILIITLIFIGLLRFLRFTVRKMKHLAINKAQKTANVDTDEATKRINTLAGIIHGIGRVFLWVIFLLIILSKFNINIAPILASAGIVGLAVGFGAQELVRDFISGFFILLENQLRTGDWAIINGTEGLVEKIELRTITLRDSAGTVHIFQNGKIDTLSNMTKEWSAIVLQIGVAYKEDTDRVCQLLQQVGDDMLHDPAYRDIILEPVSISGVNDFADSAVMIRLVIKTKPMQQWAVGREYRRRVKKLFDEQHVEFPFPYRTLTWGDSSNPIRLHVERDEPSNPTK